MGRGRGKGKKLTVVSSQEDLGSGGEEVLPIDDEGIEEILDKDEENIKSTNLMKEVKTPAAAENGRKRKKNSQVKENTDTVKEEIGSNGFRQNGSRRKSTPRRAAEAGVECK
ncbi:hypothetical protein MKW92_053384 [Papaver armeniacum]|nr:hypothetical protein MKW92_053384 [Papaver armeniacum]